MKKKPSKFQKLEKLRAKEYKLYQKKSKDLARLQAKIQNIEQKMLQATHSYSQMQNLKLFFPIHVNFSGYED